MRTYSDDELRHAVRISRSWRGVLRTLGLQATSAGAARSVRQHAARLELDHAHFTGSRHWSDVDLRAAVAGATTWSGVAQALGLGASGNTLNTVRAHAARLALDVEHLRSRCAARADPYSVDARPEFVRDSGSLFAATWFALRGVKVSWPLEPCRYDLIVHLDPHVHRVQVKTTSATGAGAEVSVANRRDAGRLLYTPDEIDYFFLITGRLDAYLIPYGVIAGRTSVSPSAYTAFQVVTAGQLIVTA